MKFALYSATENFGKARFQYFDPDSEIVIETGISNDGVLISAVIE